MILFALLPILCWLLLLILLYTYAPIEGPFTKLRAAILTATIIHGLLVVTMTEGLSFLTLVNFRYVLLSWTLVLLVLLGIFKAKRIGLEKAKEVLTVLVSIRRLGWMTWVIGGFILISLFIAVIFPPNNYDSMTYHMARVAYWIQNEHISNYPTHINRQLILQPFAEWVILHFQVLTGGDILANSVQLFYYTACISSISLLTKQLGGTTRQQLASALYTALIPMAVIQSNTTQNDIVVAFFIIAFVYFSALLLRKATFLIPLLAGCSLGLASLTKGSTYLFALPFCAWYLIAWVKSFNQSFKIILRKLVLFSLIPILALLINSGFVYRNMELNGSPLGNLSKETNNQAHAIKPLFFVAIKNVLNHFPITGQTKERLRAKAAAIGVDIDDPNYNFVPTNYMYEGIFFHEDYMQNYVHVLLIFLACLLFFLSPAPYRNRVSQYTLFVFTLITSSLLYCVLLKWQPWANRLQTPLFMLFCVMLAMEFGKLSRWVRFASYIPVLYFALGALFTSSNHPFPFSKKIYNKPLDESLIPNVAKECKLYLSQKNYTKLGLLIGPDSWDYPYHRYLSHGNGKTRTIKHVFVTNESSKYLDNFTPDAIISHETSRDKYTLNGVDYYRTVIFRDAMALFEPK